MIPSIGNFSLWLTLFFTIFQLYFANKKNNQFKIITISVYGFLIFSLLSFFCLMFSFIISDFTVSNVFQNSHTTKPLIYKISATWGNHEGSMLLWILVLSIFNFLIFSFYNKKNSTLISMTLETQSVISLGFILFTIFTSNPFARIDIPQEDGLGFNPILQDPALAIHPPLLYLGYVGFSATFSIAISVLRLNGKEDPDWYNYMKPFALTAWSFLTIGIALGSIWAYYELGWGGWWFWDPVENASFMPWLIGTALLHSLIIVEKRKSLIAWVLLLAILSFLLSVVGTFLVRSGILTSVHTFALDPTRGIYLLFLTALLGGYSLILFSINSKKYLNNIYFNFFSKEGSILINNIIMITVCATVFLGTIYPLIVESLTNNKISVGAPYYNSTVIPIIIPAILIMGIGPILSWGQEKFSNIILKIIPNIILTTLITILVSIIYKPLSFLGVAGTILAFWIITNNLLILVRKQKKHSLGMIISHMGIGLLILGITGSSVWQEEKIINMELNNKTKIKNYNIIFSEINEVRGSNYLAMQGNFIVLDEKKNIIANLKPEKRFYPITKTFTTEASIHTNLLRDLYIVLGDINIDKDWVVKIYYNPLVVWIWIGSFTIFIGGLISLNYNLKRTRKISV